MRKSVWTALLAAVLLALPAVNPLRAQDKKEAAKAPEPMKLKVGDMAPDFTLTYLDSQGKLQRASLRDYRGKKQVALAFYVFAFTGG